jgi:hypothetical protein
VRGTTHARLVVEGEHGDLAARRQAARMRGARSRAPVELGAPTLPEVSRSGHDAGEAGLRPGPPAAGAGAAPPKARNAAPTCRM